MEARSRGSDPSPRECLCVSLRSDLPSSILSSASGPLSRASSAQPDGAQQPPSDSRRGRRGSRPILIRLGRSSGGAISDSESLCAATLTRNGNGGRSSALGWPAGPDPRLKRTPPTALLPLLTSYTHLLLSASWLLRRQIRPSRCPTRCEIFYTLSIGLSLTPLLSDRRGLPLRSSTSFPGCCLREGQG